MSVSGGENTMKRSSLKILIITGIYPPDIGGPATYVSRMASALANRGHLVTVVAPQDWDNPGPIIDPAYRLVRFYRAKYIRYINYLIEFWRAFFQIYREAKECDLIYHNGLGIPPVIVGMLLGKPLVTKVVGDKAWEWSFTRGWTQKNLDAFQDDKAIFFRFLRWYHHAPVRRANTVITPSKYLARTVHLWGVPQNKIQVVYNAFEVPTNLAGKGPGPVLGENFQKGFRLVTVGRLIPHKGILGIIKAVERMNDTILLIVGDGLLRKELEAYVSKVSLSERVFFCGRLSQQELWGVLAQYAEGIVLNSTYEGLPHVLLEAAYFGVPIIATAVGGTVEFIEDEVTGLLIHPNRPGELEKAIRRLKDEAGLRKVLQKNARETLKKFSYQKQVEDTENILLEVLQ